MTILDAVPPEGSEITVVQLSLRPCPLRTEIPPDSLNLLIMLCTVEGEISKSLPIFLWGTLFLNISIIFSRICWQTGDPRPIFAPKGLDLSWMLLLYQIIITITCWHHLFQSHHYFNQFTSLLALNCSVPTFLECVAGLNDRKGCIFTNDMKLTRQNMKYFVFILSAMKYKSSKFRITTFFFYLRFPYCPNFSWFGVVL